MRSHDRRKCLKLLTRPDNGLPIVDRKGKGKARQDYYESDPEDVPGPYQLRSRNANIAPKAPESPRKKAAAGRGGKKGKKKGPQITAQHCWKCPLASCGLRHVSVQFDDSEEWVQDKERGAIAVFV